MTRFQDLFQLAEDDRITQIGNAAMANNRVAFFTDVHPVDKVERYIAKIRKRFPRLRVESQTHGPTQGVITVVLVKADA